MRIFRNLLLTVVSSAALAACAQPNSRPELAFSQPAEAEIKTVNLDELQALPEPFRKVAVAVYKFEDLTGRTRSPPPVRLKAG
jgi:curli production assembly/transport component CsgG